MKNRPIKYDLVSQDFEHEERRRNLWVDACVGLCGYESGLTPDKVATEVLKEFDRIFPNPNKKAI